MSQLEFEKTILEVEGKIAELRKMEDSSEMDMHAEITRLENKAEKLLNQTKI